MENGPKDFDPTINYAPKGSHSNLRRVRGFEVELVEEEPGMYVVKNAYEGVPYYFGDASKMEHITQEQYQAWLAKQHPQSNTVSSPESTVIFDKKEESILE